MTYDDWKTSPPDQDTEPRAPGCLCDWEIGDSPCPVHGEDEPDYPPCGKCIALGPIAPCDGCYYGTTPGRSGK